MSWWIKRCNYCGCLALCSTIKLYQMKSDDVQQERAIYLQLRKWCTTHIKASEKTKLQIIYEKQEFFYHKNLKIYYLYSRLTSFRIITCVVHSPKPPPPLYKEGEMRFFKNGCNGGGGDGKFLLEMGDKSQEWGDGKFLKSLYIVGRGVLITLFYEYPP